MIRIDDSGIEIDAGIIAEGLGLDPAVLREHMREGRITSRCERGIGEDDGRWRLTFFSSTRRLRLVVDAAGRIEQRSMIDFGDRMLPDSMRRSAA